MANWPTHRARQAERRHRHNAARLRRRYERKGLVPKKAKPGRTPPEPIREWVWEYVRRTRRAA